MCLALCMLPNVTLGAHSTSCSRGERQRWLSVHVGRRRSEREPGDTLQAGPAGNNNCVVAMSSESDAWTHMQWRTSDSWSWKTNPELTVHNIEIELWSRTQCCFVIRNYWLHTCTRTKLHTNGIGFFCAAHKIPSFKIMQNLLLLIKIAINLKYLEPGIRRLCSREEQRERERCRWSRLASLRSSHASACRTQSHFSVTFAESAQS